MRKIFFAILFVFIATAALATVSTNPSRNEYIATAGQTIFNYTFKIYENTDLNVYITPSGQDPDDSIDITTAYTVTNVGADAGGTIILDSGATLNDAVTIASAIPTNRTIDYQFNGDFRPNVVNNDFDRAISLIKQSEDLNGRTLILDESVQGGPYSLPAPDALKFIRWKTDESGFENTELTTTGTVVEGDIVEQVNGVLGLITVSPGSGRKTYSTGGFLNDSYEGGGVFVWDSTANKNTADGGTIIDPDTTGGFDGTLSTVVAYLAAQGSGVGSGCWIRLLDGYVTPEMFGAPTDETTAAHVQVQAAYDAAADTSSSVGALVLTRTYIIDASLDFTTGGNKGILVTGTGSRASTAQFKAGSNLASATKPTGLSGVYGGSIVLDYNPILLIDNASRIKVQNLEIDGSGENVYGVYLNEVFFSDFTSMWVTGCNKDPWTKIRVQNCSFRDCEMYLNGQGTSPEARMVLYDTSALTLINPTFERNGSTGYMLNIFQPNNKGGWALFNPWFEVGTTETMPALGFMSVGGKNFNVIGGYQSYGNRATTEELINFKRVATSGTNPGDRLSKDGLLMETTVADNCRLTANDVSDSGGFTKLAISAGAGTRSNYVDGVFDPALVTDDGDGNSFNINAQLVTPVPHFTDRFQVRDGDLGTGTTDFVLDVDYNGGTREIRMLGNANNKFDLNGANLQMNANAGINFTSSGSQVFNPGANNGVTMIFTGTGSNKTLLLSGLPTASGGLVSGQVWNNSGVLNIIP